MAKQSYPSHLAVVCAIWWVVLIIYDLFEDVKKGGALDMQSGIKTIQASAALLLFEMFIALLFLFWNLKSKLACRQNQLIALREHVHFGLHSTMGELTSILKNPIPLKALSNGMPNWLLQSQDYEFAHLIIKFIEITKINDPLIACAMTNCLALLCQYKEYPSSSMNSSSCSDENAQLAPEVSTVGMNNPHGHCSLLDHSLRVAAYALIERNRFIYRGLDTGLSKVPAANQKFEFDPEDPLSILLALVHDIGKIKTFQLNERNEVIRVNGQHGPVGASLLTHLECIQALPIEDRNVLYKAMHHYHAPFQYALKEDGLVDDDRTVACMMLLISADKKASRAERFGKNQEHDHQLLNQLAIELAKNNEASKKNSSSKFRSGD